MKTYKEFISEGYGGPGMWMPKQNDSGTWELRYVVYQNGKKHEITKRFRTKSNAMKEKKELKAIEKRAKERGEDIRVDHKTWEVVRVKDTYQSKAKEKRDSNYE